MGFLVEVVGIVALAGCYSPSVAPGGLCSDNGTCPAGQQCYDGRCFVTPPTDDAADDAVDAPPDAPPDAAIDACGGNVCQGGNLVGCGTSTTCTYGCLTTGMPHCARITPSNALSWDLVPFPGGTLTLNLGAHVFDTTTGVLTTDGTPVALPSAVTTLVVGAPVQIQVLALGDLQLETGAILTVKGSRPFAILADGNVTVNVGAMILLGASCTGGAFDPTCGGPGGGHGGRLNADPATGCGAGQNGYMDILGPAEAGGGGGGYGRSGENSASVTVGEGGRGDSCGASGIEPLIGGSGGGAGGIDPAVDVRVGGRGGGGGGAIQITASGTLLVMGTIDAAGAGGENGYFDGTGPGNGGGGGGGSGGGILLEGGILMVPGTITANGGSGGGNNVTVATGQGENGRRDRTCAVGGLGNATASPGGRGDCDTQGPSNGGTIGDRGGGGGGVGRLRFNARSTQLGGATISGTQSNGGPPPLQ